MNVFFRVDSSYLIGTGHVMRCLALAEKFKDNGVNSVFICREHRGNQIEKIMSKGYIVHRLDIRKKKGTLIPKNLTHYEWLGVSQVQDAEDCFSIMQSKQINLLVVDHYAIDHEWQKKLKPLCDKLMVIDDLADRKHNCDFLLDQTFGRTEYDYKNLVPKNCKLLLGSKFALLRSEFNKWRPYSLKRRIKPQFKTLLINMGGIDINNVTETILDQLEYCKLPHYIRIIILIGKNSPHIDRIKFKANALAHKTEIKIDVDNMAEIMANSDLAIGAAGSTTWERCCLGLPSIQIIIAKNQVNIAKFLAKHDAIKLLENTRELSKLMNNQLSWMLNVSENSRKVTDGLGTNRVYNIIIKNSL